MYADGLPETACPYTIIYGQAAGGGLSIFTVYYRFVYNPFKNVSHFFHNSKI